MAKKTFPENERRAIASIFFTFFDNLSLEDIRNLLGNRIGKSTISRDKRGLKDRDAPSSASTAAYAAALGYDDTLDPDNPDLRRAVVERTVSARRDFSDAQPIERRFTSAVHPCPARTMSRLLRALDARRWESVIDIIETFREGDVSQKHASIAPYLEFYLGLACRNLGDVANALAHFQAAYAMIPDDTNEERDFLSHASLNYALALQDAGQPLPEPKVLDHLLSLAVACMPMNFPETLVNALIAASRLPDDYFGVSAERVASKIRGLVNLDELSRLRATFLAQSELKHLQKNDMFLHVIAALDERIQTIEGA